MIRLYLQGALASSAVPTRVIWQLNVQAPCRPSL